MLCQTIRLSKNNRLVITSHKIFVMASRYLQDICYTILCWDLMGRSNMLPWEIWVIWFWNNLAEPWPDACIIRSLFADLQQWNFAQNCFKTVINCQIFLKCGKISPILATTFGWHVRIVSTTSFGRKWRIKNKPWYIGILGKMWRQSYWWYLWARDIVLVGI